MIKYCYGYWEDIKKIIEMIPQVENLKGKSILITGSTGMICSALVDTLFYLNKELSYDIKLILAGRDEKKVKQRFYSFVESKDYKYMFFDATINNDIDIRCDYIIHGASNANPSLFSKEPVETMVANFEGIHRLLNMAKNNNVTRILYVSSSEVYGNNKDNKSYKENDYGYIDLLNPRASYPISKRSSETLCIAYSEEYNIDTVIVRPGHIYGPTITQNDDRASAQFTRLASQKKDIIMKSKGLQLRSYCYVFDCASAILAVLLNGEKSNAYNISNKDSIVTISDIAFQFADAFKKSVLYKEASLQEKKGYNLMENSSLDSKKIEQLGWSACFSLEEGVISTLKYYIENEEEN